MVDLRIAVFAEGSDSYDPFEKLWRGAVQSCLELRSIHSVYGISKKHLIAMDPTMPKMSGAGESLDAFMARKMQKSPFDVAVIIWDLQPEWNPDSNLGCRWQETLQLYRLLANSAHLRTEWKQAAEARYTELASRSTPSSRMQIPQIAPYTVLAICMEPEFEAWFTDCEACVRRALRVDNRHVPDWPRSWNQPGVRQPSMQLLQPAINAVKRAKLQEKIPRGDMRTAKHEWNEYFIRRFSADARSKEHLQKHAIGVRLKEILGR